MTTLQGSKMPLWTVLARPFLIFKEALSVGEDYWTWRTLQGKIYEDVVLVRLNRTDVTIRHKYGMATIARAELTEQIQRGLIENFEMAEPEEIYSGRRHNHYLPAMPLAHAK